jgi:hypothetical protein
MQYEQSLLFFDIRVTDRTQHSRRASAGWCRIRIALRSGRGVTPKSNLAAALCGDRAKEQDMDNIGTLTSQPNSQLLYPKHWAARGLYDVVAQNPERLDAQDAEVVFRVFDHMHVANTGFQNHMLGLPRRFNARQSEKTPGFRALSSVREVVAWYTVLCRPTAGERFRSVRGFCVRQPNPGPHAAGRDHSARVPARNVLPGQCRHHSPQECDYAQERLDDGVSRIGVAS